MRVSDVVFGVLLMPIRRVVEELTLFKVMAFRILIHKYEHGKDQGSYIKYLEDPSQIFIIFEKIYHILRCVLQKIRGFFFKSTYLDRKDMNLFPS